MSDVPESVTASRPPGRPPGALNKNTADIRALARSYGPDAIMRLAELAGFAVGEDGKRLPAAVSEATQIAATNSLLDRGYGKAVQPVAGADGEGPVITEVVYRWGKSEE